MSMPRLGWLGAACMLTSSHRRSSVPQQRAWAARQWIEGPTCIIDQHVDAASPLDHPPHSAVDRLLRRQRQGGPHGPGGRRTRP